MMTPGPYEHRGAYTSIELHTGPVGREWMAFVAECNGRLEGDGAAQAALPPAVAATSTPQPAPSPLSQAGGVR